MPIVRVDKDLENHTMTVVAEYDAPIERVWQLYADPRQLEQISYGALVEVVLEVVTGFGSRDCARTFRAV